MFKGRAYQLSGNHMVCGNDKNECLHDKTEVIDWCKARNKECHVIDCGVLDDDIPDCNELIEKEVCTICGSDVE